MTDFLAMNGDGVFVWPCYAVTLIVLMGNLWAARRKHQRLLGEIRRQTIMQAAS